MKKIIILSVAVLALLGIFSVAQIVSANPLYFVPLVTTSSATSSPVTVTIATSSTLTLDSYTYGTTYALDRATLLIQQVASSSATITGISLQYSQDGIDWYSDNLTSTSTTPNLQDITTSKSYQLQGNSTSSTTRKAIIVATPTRFVRAVFLNSVGTSTIWASFVPARQSPNK